MIYTPLTRKAMKIAYEAHHGQIDRSGVPYIFHPFSVAQQMTDETSVCVALLHDVLEDTDVSPEFLEAEFPPAVMEAVRLMTHEASVDYFDYIRALKDHPVARAVKLADIAHNLDESRVEGIAGIPQETLQWWREKYTKARAILEEENHEEA